MDPGLLSHNCNFPKSCFSDPSGLCAKFFDPTGRKRPVCAVLGDWANFFTALLLSPRQFAKVKEIISIAMLTSSLSQFTSVEFILPSSCPIEEEPKCLLALAKEDIEEQNAEDQNPENQNPNNKDPSKSNTPKKEDQLKEASLSGGPG
jgi:hypothetical protein